MSAAAAVLCLGACGSHTYTKSDFIARADAICTSTLHSARAGSQTGDLTAYLDGLVTLLASEEQALRALPLPKQSPADKAILQRYFASLRSDLASYRALAGATRRGDAGAAADAEAALRASPTTTLATRYGLSTCSQPGSTNA